MKQDQFKYRYIIKLLSSIAVASLNIIIQFILPRAFSVEQYAYYSYNLNIFTSIVGIANLSMSGALISKFSKRNGEIGLVWFYFGFYFIEAFTLNIGITLLFPLKFIRETFTGQTFIVVLLGLETAVINRMLTDVIGIYDAMAVSRTPALFQIILKLLVCIYVVFNYFCGQLDLKVFYIGQALITLCITLGLLVLIMQFQRRTYRKIVNRGVKAYIKEYFIFCRPLVASNIVSQIIVIVMNWSLMKWAGATEQAMFGAAWQINTLMSYIFSPYAELSKREYAVMYNNSEGLRSLYIKSLKLIIWLTAYFALFVGFCSDWFLPVIYGDRYAGAAFVTLLIMVYTVFQAGGQICGSFMLAMEETKANAWMGIFGQFVTLACVFIFQIPNFIWRQGLGAIGIALTYLVPNIISVSIGVFYIAFKLKLPKFKTCCIPFIPVAICSLIAFALNGLANNFLTAGSTYGLLVKILLSGMIYTILIACMILRNPRLIGISKESIVKLLKIKV